MSYYLRAFCASADMPSLGGVFQWAGDQGVQIHTESAELDTKSWEQVEVLYKPGRLPLIAEVTTGDLLRQEVEEFIEELDDVDDAPEKQKVLDHLKGAKAVVALRLPTADIDDDGYTAAETFLRYFVEHSEGLIQADGEGFYEGDNLIVELT